MLKYKQDLLEQVETDLQNRKENLLKILDQTKKQRMLLKEFTYSLDYAANIQAD